MVATVARFEDRLEETKRLGRVLQIVQLISADPRAWNRARLAGRFELSTRQIDKDLEQIRHSLRFALRRSVTGYYFESGPFLKPIRLNLSEALALSLAAQQGRDTDAVERPAVASALGKIEDALPQRVVPYLRHAGSDEAFAPVRAPASRASTLALLERALVERREIRCSYASASGRKTGSRVLRPYRLMPYHSSWMLVAFDRSRVEVRTFNVDRIGPCEPTDASYSIPLDFDIAEYQGSAWGILRGARGPVEDVALRFSSEAAPWVRGHEWHYSQRIEELADRSLTMRFHCVVTNELVRWVLSFGGRVTVEAPRELRAAALRESRQFIEAQGDPGKAGFTPLPAAGVEANVRRDRGCAVRAHAEVRR